MALMRLLLRSLWLRWLLSLWLGLPTPAERAFWTSKETCEFLGIPLSTLRYWGWQGKGPRGYRIGREKKFKPGDVKAWAERQVAEPVVEAVKHVQIRAKKRALQK
jgi:hypothetical protein